MRPGEPLMDIVPRKHAVDHRNPGTRQQDHRRIYRGRKHWYSSTPFDTRITPHIPAKVSYISADRLEERTNMGVMPYYLCYVEIDPSALKDAKLYLSPGMPATVFITTKKRTVLFI